ncbi:MAG: SMC family ATPase [Rubrobacter sp.]|nr:SMC family ATPase [Rubrobacter sp.]
MILSRLYLENYKQFREPVELLPSEGAIGVVGPNGSGKSTIFEAILWAFFGARGGGPRFANDSIPWSGGSTADRSLVEITLDVGGASYTVSRSLQRNKTTARVLGEGGMEVTSGPSEVAAWVQEHVLGMDRVAFEATFFARQKELEFFAGVTGVERQREVARILRINQVEDAQKLLRTDKNDTLREVKWIEQQLAEADHDSLIEDLKEQSELHESLETKTKNLRSEFEKRGAELEKARAEADRLEKLYREHNRLSNELVKAVHARDRATERAAEFVAKLRGLDEDAKTVSELEPKTRGMAEISEEIAALEEARRREERKFEAQKDLRRHHETAYSASKKASEMVESLDNDGVELLPGWPDGSASDGGEVDVAREASRVLESADAAHLRSEEELRKLRDVREKHEKLEEKKSRLEKGEAAIEEARTRLEKLDEDIENVSGGLSLDEKISTLRERHDSLQRESAQKSGRADAEEREAKKMEKARRMVENSDEHAKCPTCQRGFEEDKHTEVIESLTRLEESSRKQSEALRAEHRRLDAEAEEVSKEISASEAAKSKLYDLRAGRGIAAERKEKWEEAFEEIQKEAKELREELSDSPKPSPDDLDEAKNRVGRLRKLRDSRPALESLVSDYDRAGKSADEKKEEVEKLSVGNPYDEARHTELTERRSQIQTILGQIQTLRSRLEERPSAEESLEKANEARETATEEAKRLESEVGKLGFDEDIHRKSREDAAASEKARDEARELRDESERELRGVEHVVAGLKKEVERHEAQRKDADRKSLEAASLSDMDKLFSEFYQELTARVRPQLQREASDLIKTLTDSRYEKMEFDENYGVRLYDGLSDAYEISRFSGGEADIASLCARVALSKMISGKGSGALGFIVLDEVFGALDANRRQNVLLALDRLKRTFGQLFIISHVSDVQESVLFDETWFVEEGEEGKSTVRTTTPAALEAVELSDR